MAYTTLIKAKRHDLMRHSNWKRPFFLMSTVSCSAEIDQPSTEQSISGILLPLANESILTVAICRLLCLVRVLV